MVLLRCVAVLLCHRRVVVVVVAVILSVVVSLLPCVLQRTSYLYMHDVPRPETAKGVWLRTSCRHLCEVADCHSSVVMKRGNLEILVSTANKLKSKLYIVCYGWNFEKFRFACFSSLMTGGIRIGQTKLQP